MLIANIFPEHLIVRVRKLWESKRHLRIELVAFFLFLPSFLLMIGQSIFELEKACKVNLKIDRHICDNLNNIQYKNVCTTIENNVEHFKKFKENQTALLLEKFVMAQELHPFVKDTKELKLIESTCDAEKSSQRLISKLYAIRAPIGTIFTFIIVLFAGAWSDKHDIRKAFILIPFIGQLLTSFVLIVSAMYMDTIPVEYAVYSAKIIPAIFGDYTLFMIGVHSYMTITTDEKNRTFRLGFYSMFITFLGIFGSPLSGMLFEWLSYVELFTLCLGIQTAGLICVLLFVPEVKSGPVSDKNDKQNPIPNYNSINVSKRKDSLLIIKKSNLFLDFFDPSHVKNSFSVLTTRREGKQQRIFIFVILCNTIFFATVGEEGLYILFTRTALKWTTEFSYYITYITATGVIGTAISTLLFVNVFKIADPTLGIISTVGTIIANPLIALSRSNHTAYLSATIDIFFNVRYVAIKSMISKLVDSSELGRAYSVLGITENLDSIIFTPIYSLIYYKTLDSLPGAFFLFSDMFLILALFVFIYLRSLDRSNTGDTHVTQLSKYTKRCDSMIY